MDSTIKIILLYKCVYRCGLMKILDFMSWPSLKTSQEWYESCFIFLKHLKVSFAISVRDTQGVQDVWFVFMSPIQKCIHLLLYCVWAFFWQESSPANFSQNLVWVKVYFSSHSDAFLFWCTLFHLHSVSRKGRITDMHWKCPHKAVKNCIFKTSIKYMAYAVNCKEYIASYPHT